MTITEFLNQGGEIDPEWDFISHCSASFTNNSISPNDDYQTCDDLVQYACDEDSYQENQHFDTDSERFYVVDPTGKIMGKHLTNSQATRLIHNYKGAE